MLVELRIGASWTAGQVLIERRLGSEWCAVQALFELPPVCWLSCGQVLLGPRFRWIAAWLLIECVSVLVEPRVGCWVLMELPVGVDWLRSLWLDSFRLDSFRLNSF